MPKPDHNNTLDNSRDRDDRITRPSSDPFALPYPWWYELYQRIKLVPWWINYNFGATKEAGLKDKIIDLAREMGLQDSWVKKVVRHAVSEFSKKGLGPDYYGYHNLDHELEATYFTLLAAKGQKNDKKFSYKDICFLFVSALFHDFNPLKEFDKPHEEDVEWFLRHDVMIQNFMKEAGIRIDITLALIYRTAYPFEEEIKTKALKRMQELFTSAGIPEDDMKTRKHYEDIGWFLSVAERIAGYALGDFARSIDLATRNAHALGWHQSVINMESVNYFSKLKNEIEMFNSVMESLPEDYRKRFNDNVANFQLAWERELEIRMKVKQKQLTFVSAVEEMRNSLVPNLKETLFKLHSTLPPPRRVEEKIFQKSFERSDTLLVTLRLNDERSAVVGYAKGGPLEHYKLRKGTHDENKGKRNTIYLEPMSIELGYWGVGGGHLLRQKFLSEAKKRGYQFLTSYVHRNEIEHRIAMGEPTEIVRKYDPDKLDYYRLRLVDLHDADVSLSAIATPENLRGENL